MLKLEAIEPRGLEAISLDLADGECLAVTGPSGSGKTVFLRAVADLDENGGDAAVNGMRRSEVPAYEWRSQVMYVPTESGWWADTVSDHLTDRDVGTDLISGLGLPADCLDWPVSRLSTGEKQRLALGRALALKPAVLLLDEPTAALDGETTVQVESVLQRCAEAGATLVIVTHDPEQASRLGARTADICDGRIVIMDSEAPA